MTPRSFGRIAIVHRGEPAMRLIRAARGTGSVHKIVAANGLRPYLIDAIHRGMQRTLNTTGGQR